MSGIMYIKEQNSGKIDLVIAKDPFR